MTNSQYLRKGYEEIWPDSMEIGLRLSPKAKGALTEIRFRGRGERVSIPAAALDELLDARRCAPGPGSNFCMMRFDASDGFVVVDTTQFFSIKPRPNGSQYSIFDPV